MACFLEIKVIASAEYFFQHKAEENPLPPIEDMFLLMRIRTTIVIDKESNILCGGFIAAAKRIIIPSGFFLKKWSTTFRAVIQDPELEQPAQMIELKRLVRPIGPNNDIDLIEVSRTVENLNYLQI